jgi:hypothetical protein
MRYVVWLLIAGLIILHQDYWQWGDARLVFGFLPYTLFYHACLSIAAAVVWWMATRFCWPSYLDRVPVDPDQPPP